MPLFLKRQCDRTLCYFQDQARRAAAQELEFAWTPDPLNRPGVGVFGHLMCDNTAGYSFTLPQTKKGDKGEQVGFGRIVVSETKAPNILVNLV